MVDAFDVAKLIALNGGQLVGRTRLQKSAYFLEAKGVGMAVDFSYHRFGPYSEELAAAADDAIALRIVELDWKSSQTGDRYAIFRSKNPEPPTRQGDDQRRAVLDLLKDYSSVEIELAATAHFLQQNGFAKDPWAETRRRKASKATPDRVSKAQYLLTRLETI